MLNFHQHKTQIPYLMATCQHSVFCLEQALEHYQQSLADTERAQSYLIQKRGLDWHWLSENYHAGFGDRSLGKSFPSQDAHENESVRGALRRTGFLDHQGKEIFRGCITIPIYDKEHNILNIYGRKVASYLRPDNPLHVTMKPVGSELFNQSVLEEQTSIVLCSSPLEALTLLSLGADNVVSLCGMNALSAAQLEYLKEKHIRCVEVAFANTPRGNRYASKVVCQLDKAGIRFKRTTMPAGEDINSLHVKARGFAQICEILH